MHEIEVKARVANPGALKSALASLGVTLGQPITQNDTVYTEGDWEFVKFQNDRNILRIRIQDGRAILTLKRSGVNELHSIEHETVVDDPGETEEILHLMGYQPIVKVNKRRQKAEYCNMELCLDEVAGLGTYIEVERLVEEGDAEAIQAELFEFLRSLGIPDVDRETRGYDTLVRLQSQ